MAKKGFLNEVIKITKDLNDQRIAQQKKDAKEEKKRLKVNEALKAQYEVDHFENLSETITSFHHKTPIPVNWEFRTVAEPPPKPEVYELSQSPIQEKIDSLNANLFGKIINFTKIKALDDKLTLAKYSDAKENQKRIKKHERELGKWQFCKSIAPQILSGEGYIDALSELVFDYDDNSEEKLDLLKHDEVEIEIFSNKEITIKVPLIYEGIIPSSSKTLLKSGNVSERDFTDQNFNLLLQKYICSLTISIARHIFAVLPIEQLTFNSTIELTNPLKGIKEDSVVLSVLFRKSKFEELNFLSLCPVSFIKSCSHKMKLSKSKGLQPVLPLGKLNKESNSQVIDGYIYILTSHDKQYSDLVKIGMTTMTTEERISGALTSPTYLYNEVEIVYDIPVFNYDTYAIEQGIHEKLDQYRRPITNKDGTVATEWFKMSSDDAYHIVQGMLTGIRLGV